MPGSRLEIEFSYDHEDMIIADESLLKGKVSVEIYWGVDDKSQDVSLEAEDSIELGEHLIRLGREAIVNS